MKNRQAEVLARALDGGESTVEVHALAQLATAMERSAAPTATAVRPEFRSELRAALVSHAREAAAAPSLLERIRQATERWRYSTRLATATGAAALALSGGGVAAASQHALPGEILYPVKLAMEDARVALVRDVSAKGDRYLSYATERVIEARLSLDAGSQSGAARALREADDSARKGATHLLRAFQDEGDRSALERLSRFATDQRRRIAGLYPMLEGEAARAARDSLVVLDRIEQRIVALEGCRACEPGPPPTGEAFDFTFIPQADESFDACPCAPESRPVPPPLRPQPSPTPAEDREPGPSNGDPPPADDEPDPGIIPTLPGPLEDSGNLVNDLLKDVIEKNVEKALPSASASDPKPGLISDPEATVEEGIAPVQQIIDGVLSPVDDATDSLTETEPVTDSVSELFR